jgi:hypothetical protein
MSTSSEIIDEDIKCLEDLNYKIILEIAAETTSKLSENQEQLQHEALQNIETMEDLIKLRESVRPTLL